MVDTSSAAALCYVRLGGGGGGRGWVVIQTQRQMRARSQKKIFLAPRAHFSLKQTGGGGGGGPFGSATEQHSWLLCSSLISTDS